MFNVLMCIFLNFNEVDSGYSAPLDLASQLIIVLVILPEINVISPVSSRVYIQSLACALFALMTCIKFVSLEA